MGGPRALWARHRQAVGRTLATGLILLAGLLLTLAMFAGAARLVPTPPPPLTPEGGTLHP
jgi:hypothetical protein